MASVKMRMFDCTPALLIGGCWIASRVLDATPSVYDADLVVLMLWTPTKETVPLLSSPARRLLDRGWIQSRSARGLCVTRWCDAPLLLYVRHRGAGGHLSPPLSSVLFGVEASCECPSCGC